MAQGFEVTKNRQVYDENGAPPAEFDVEIRGKLGSGEIAWLIECRDRPAEGPSPGAWIQQLVGRGQDHKFNKVTAVSTTGFAQEAISCAKKFAIDLRHVNEIALRLQGMHSRARL